MRRYVGMWFHGPRQLRHVYCGPSVYPPSFNSFALHRRHLTPRKTPCLLEPVHFGLGGRSLFFRSGSGVFAQSWSETNNIRPSRGRESWPPAGTPPPRSGLFMKGLPCGVGRTLHVAWVALAYAPQLSNRWRNKECPQWHRQGHPVKSSRKCWHADSVKILPSNVYTLFRRLLSSRIASKVSVISLTWPFLPLFHRPIHQLPCHRSCYPSYLSAPTCRLRRSYARAGVRGGSQRRNGVWYWLRGIQMNPQESRNLEGGDQQSSVSNRAWAATGNHQSGFCR